MRAERGGMSSTGKPPAGSFGRRKAISRAESAATQDSLQAAMDLEVAIGTSSYPNDAATVQGGADDEIRLASQDLGLRSQPAASITNVASMNFLTSNSLAGVLAYPFLCISERWI